jgi:hypothetical protein
VGITPPTKSEALMGYDRYLQAKTNGESRQILHVAVSELNFATPKSFSSLFEARYGNCDRPNAYNLFKDLAITLSNTSAA